MLVLDYVDENNWEPCVENILRLNTVLLQTLQLGAHTRVYLDCCNSSDLDNIDMLSSLFYKEMYLDETK